MVGDEPELRLIFIPSFEALLPEMQLDDVLKFTHNMRCKPRTPFGVRF
jgi:hypothetical protein